MPLKHWKLNNALAVIRSISGYFCHNFKCDTRLIFSKTSEVKYERMHRKLATC